MSLVTLLLRRICFALMRCLFHFVGGVASKFTCSKNLLKCEVKIVSLVDGRTAYFYNDYVYSSTGYVNTGLNNKEKNSVDFFLVQPIVNNKRNITSDSWLYD